MKLDTTFWLLPAVLAFPFGYELRFTEVTLCMGMELLLGKKWSDFEASFARAVPIMRNECRETPLPTGFQDAITPPWKALFAVSTYLGCAVAIGLMWWRLGWVAALCGVVIIFVGAKIAQLVLPKPTGTHYRRLIIHSMISRYADYTRDGDGTRANAMLNLLTKAGMDVEALEERSD